MCSKDLRRAKNSILAGITIFTLVSFLLSCSSFSANGQSEISFGPVDKFDIPANNSSISFAINGTYEKASLENGVWSFENLLFVNSQRMEKLSLRVSATDCKVKIISYLIYNGTLGGENVRSAFLRYTVIGHGTQAFDLGLDPKRGEWGVILNGVFEGINHGWKVSPEGTPIITGATANVTLSYYGYPDSYVDSANDLNQHSVVISSTFFVAIVVLLAAIIAIKKKELK